jgi:hypothetical protein
MVRKTGSEKGAKGFTSWDRFQCCFASLAVHMYDWAKYKTTKGAVKLHLLLDHDGYLPVFMDITKGNTRKSMWLELWSSPKGNAKFDSTYLLAPA